MPDAQNSWDMRPGPDSDGDGLTDDFERKVSITDVHNRDTDGDGLNDLREKDFGSDPLSPDTDHDGLEDGREVTLGTNPRAKDTDGDGISDLVEANRHTIRRADMDEDGDGEVDWVQRAHADDDHDILTNGEEAWLGTDPRKKDTDGDGADDYEEAMGVKGNNPRFRDFKKPTGPPAGGRQGSLDPSDPAGGGLAASQPLVDPLVASAAGLSQRPRDEGDGDGDRDPSEPATDPAGRAGAAEDGYT
ncbi:MAG TPA: hypothetical protein VF743_05085, partial [Acidimicrobiales bacterium]